MKKRNGLIVIVVVLGALVLWLRMPEPQGLNNTSSLPESAGRPPLPDDVDTPETDPDTSAPGSWEELVDEAMREGRSTFGTVMVEESGIMRFPDPDIIPLVGHDGIITYQTMSEIGITKEEAVIVQAEIEAVNAEMATVARKHTKLDGCDPTDTEDTTCYTISPYAEEGREVVQRFAERLSQLIGPERGEKVVDSFVNSVRFADFGKFEVYARFQDFRKEDAMPISELHDAMYLRVNYAIINPESGKRISGGTDTYDGFRMQFGDIFAVEAGEVEVGDDPKH